MSLPPPAFSTAAMAFLNASRLRVLPSPTPPKSTSEKVRFGILGRAGLTFSAADTSTSAPTDKAGDDRVAPRQVRKRKVSNGRFIDGGVTNDTANKERTRVLILGRGAE